MTYGPELPLPTARVLQGWWRELAELQPRRLWFGQLLLHHLDACVETSHQMVLDPLRRVLLRALATGDSRLAAFDAQLRARLLHELTQSGFVSIDNDSWSLTATGHAAVAGSFLHRRRERRSFWFLDNRASGKPPQFLQPRHALEPIAAPEGWNFPVEALVESVRQSAAWKQQHRFPEEVSAVVDFAATPDDLHNVMIDRPERFLGIILETEKGVTAYSVQTNSWVLDRKAPAFTLSTEWNDLLEDLAVELEEEQWRQAWLAWCQVHGVAEANACRLERTGHRLLVHAPKTLAGPLRTMRDEPLKHDGWLLVGTGRFRSAAQLDMTEI